uniref:Variant surface glycoprotein 1125.291 n=1 Tax=Trypanosoma brucei TaxID=5691 RepID=A0A1J0R5L2_9TRYP|nr:variant surface glycoprotein 1125.291 [Trypanosoma brucei]
MTRRRQNFKRLCLLQLIHLLATAALRTAGNDENDKVAAAVDNPCKEEAYLKGLKQHLQSKLSQDVRAMANLQEASEIWAMLSLTAADPQERCIHLALSSRANKQKADAQTANDQAKRQVAAAIDAINKQLGSVAAIRTLAGLKINEKTGQHVEDSDAQVTIKFHLERGGAPACTDVPAANKIVESTEPDYTKAMALKLTTPEEAATKLRAAKLVISSISSCGGNGGAPSALPTVLNNCQMGASPSAQMTQEGTDLKTPTATAIFKDNYLGTCGPQHDNPTTAAHHRENLAHAICLALKARIVTPPATDSWDPQQLKTNPFMQTAIRNCVPQFQSIDDSTNSDKNKDLTQFIENALRKSAENFKQKYVEEAKTRTVPRRTAKEAETKLISELLTQDDQSTVLSHALGQKLKAQQSTSKSDGAAAPKKDCADKNKDECTKESKCGWKGTDNNGECKAKSGEEEVKAENDGKTTNTTGSNSFAINKAPLLLAFLLM